MKKRFRQLKDRVHDGLESFRASSAERQPQVIDSPASHAGSTAKSRQSNIGISLEKDPDDQIIGTSDAASSTCQFDASRNKSASPAIRTIDLSDWNTIWSEAYTNVKEDPEHSKLLKQLEKFLATEDNDDDIDSADDLPTAPDDNSRLGTIQKITKAKLDSVSEAHLSIKIGEKTIGVRENILKAVKVINALKPIISGAVAAEPSAALAWAGVTTVLPILESIFKQDEDAATGLVNITFLMARYQVFHEADFASQLQLASQPGASQKLLYSVKDELVSLYGKVYVYQARFVLQYGRRNKFHRALRNAGNADNWKESWSEIDSNRLRIDQGIQTQVNVTTVATWKMVKEIQDATQRFGALQQDMFRVVQDFDRRQLMLSLQVTGSAIFDARRKSKMEVLCMPGTQRHILQRIQDWTDDPDGTMILWLEGMAGTGKTSISFTVASMLDDDKPFTDPARPPSEAVLGASFFFAQGDATRNSTDEFFRTIAWCLADVLPGFGILLTEAIKENPGIQTKASRQQFQKLIIDPLSVLDQKSFVRFQLVVVIDALDECVDEDAEDLLGMLENLKNLRQIQLRLLVTSRREAHISMAFKHLPDRLYQAARLNKIQSSTDGNNDIVSYLTHSLDTIAKKWHVTDGGVGHDDILKLAEKADGLFIYAATACRYLNSRHFFDKGFRDRRLNIFFEDRWEKDGPQNTIDGIYVKVLSFPETESWTEEEQIPFYTEISQLIGFIAVLARPASVETLCHLLSKTKQRLEYLLVQLHSIIDVPKDTDDPISLVHLSFREFILNEKRSERLPFSIKESEMHRDVLHRCLALMNSHLRQDICCLSLPGSLASDVDPSHISSYIPQYLSYACRYWVHHLVKAFQQPFATDGFDDAEYQTCAHAVEKLLKEKLLYWLEAMAFTGEAPSIIPMLNDLETFIGTTSNADLSSFLYDAKRFVLSNMWGIEHTPLQIYCSAFLFCPKDNLLRLYYQNMIPEWITQKPEPQKTSTAELCRLEGHTDEIWETQFSPTEPLLASISADQTTRVWEYLTGTEKYVFEEPATPFNVCFSADGSKLASACPNGIVSVRDLRRGTEIRLYSSSSTVQRIAFSPISSNVLALISRHNELSIWFLDENKQVTVSQLPSSHICYSIVFSPDGKLVAVCQDYDIILCDVEQRGVVHRYKHRMIPEVCRDNDIPEMAFSTDSRVIAVRYEESIDFWEINTPDPSLIRTYTATWSEHSPFLFLSPDENLDIQEGCATVVDLFELSTGDFIGSFSKSFVKHSPVGDPLQVDYLLVDPTIRIVKGLSTLTSSQEEEYYPKIVEFVDGNITAISYCQGMEARRWGVIDRSMQPFKDRVISIKYSPDGHFILLQVNDGFEYQVWDKTLTHRVAIFHEKAAMVFVLETCHLVALSLSGNLQNLYHDSESFEFKVKSDFDLTGVVFESIQKPGTAIATPLHISPNGKEVAIFLTDINMNCSLHLWNIVKGEYTTNIRYPRIQRIVFSPDSEFIGVGYGVMDSETQLLHTSNGKEVDGCHLDGYAFLVFHPSDRMFAIESNNRSHITNPTVKVLGGIPWLTKFEFQIPDGQRVHDLFFSASNKLAVLLTGRGENFVVDVWDTTAKHKISSQTLMFHGLTLSLSFSQSEDSLESNRGRIPIPTQDVGDGGSHSPFYRIHDCLYVLDDWVYQGHERLIWLPPSHRPSFTYTRDVDVRHDTIAIAHAVNSVIFIAVSLKDTPVAKYYLELSKQSVTSP